MKLLYLVSVKRCFFSCKSQRTRSDFFLDFEVRKWKLLDSCHECYESKAKTIENSLTMKQEHDRNRRKMRVNFRCNLLLLIHFV